MDKVIFQLNSPFTVRLIADEMELINDNMVKLYPACVDDPNEKPTSRGFLMSVVEKALSTAQKSNPVDLEKIEKLEKEVIHLKGLQDQNRLTIDALHKEKEELTGMAGEFESKLQEEIENLKGEIILKAERIETLQNRLIPENSIVMELTPLEHAVTKAIRQKYEAKFKKPISQKDVIFSTFWLYHILQEWEFSKLPFVISKGDLKRIEKQIPANE